MMIIGRREIRRREKARVGESKKETSERNDQLIPFSITMPDCIRSIVDMSDCIRSIVEHA